MSSTLVTQCPHCQTRFRLSQDHLRAAAGNVRCGACLKVFNANPPATDAEQAEPPAGMAPASPGKGKMRLDDVLIHDDLELDELDLEDLGLDESIIDEVNPTPDHTPPPADSQPTAEEPTTASVPASNPPATDTTDAGATATITGEQTATPVAADITRRDLPADTQVTQPADEPVVTAPDQEVVTAPRHEPEIGDELQLPELDADALLLDHVTPIQRPRHTLLWTALSLLALLGLLAQFVYFNFASLAHNVHSRPLLTAWCQLAHCQLPPQVDISQIRSSNLTLRQHPEYPNTLAIDVILYNRADFAQPFPLLRMRFSDQQQREVSSRLFYPEEYLGGELAGTRLMPSQTPIHIGLSMLAPDQAGSSYQLDFLSPEQPAPARPDD